ncbi:MAG: SDR family oxidoreductase [Planctomycetes bacterium]|nr:SDR family oxidoreductase [Planctomycetota bacterium]
MNEPDEQGGRTSPVALITCGTNGLGRAVGKALAGRGWSLFLQHTATDSISGAAEDLQAVADEADMGGEVAAGQGDLTIAQDRELLIEQVLEVFGQIDMLVNVPEAAPRGRDDLLDVAEDTFRDVMESSLTSAFFLTQLAASEMVRLVEAGRIENPRIVTVNSISAYATSVSHACYCISRSALSMMTRLFADRLGVHGISVYEVRVGNLAAGEGEDVSDVSRGISTPIARRGRVNDVARAVLAIAQGLLSYSTGEVINVDGGFHLRRL